MAMISIENLTFSYPTSADPVFDNVSFRIDTNWKLGFIGRNGKGKTTLLRLLLGSYPYRGKIESPVEFIYFPHPVEDKTKSTTEILREIAPEAEEWQLRRELSALGVRESALLRPFASLSGGEQTKVLLAALFSEESRFPLIDEPTNHLDADARSDVAAYLARKKGFILVSHDRRFLDGCVDHILSLNRATLEVQSGNYSSWQENFERRQKYESIQNERLHKDIARLKTAAQRSSGWADRVEASKIGAADKGFIGHKSAKMMKRAKSIQARQQRAIKEKTTLLKDAERTDALKLRPLTYRRDLLVSLKGVAPVYSRSPITSPVSLEIRAGERVFLDGKNGSGKSSILRLLLNQPIDHTGSVEIGSGLIISYVPQSASSLNGTLSAFAKENRIDESLFTTILRKMDFSRPQLEKDMQDFSQGQKKKVLLAKSLCEQAHLYIWDEPLNYIDLYSRVQIERLIAEFSPTMLLVEHDAAFREAIATKVIHL